MESSLPPPPDSPPPPPSTPPPPAPSTPPGSRATDERNLAMLCHLLGLAGLVFPLGGNIIGPLVLWLLKRDTMPAVDLAGKEALNFQITVSLVALVCCVTWFLILPLFALGAVIIGAVILTIIASVQTSNGVDYRYPFTIRFLK